MNFLLTSVGRRGYLVKYFKDVVGKSGLIHVSNSEDTFVFKYADGHFISPLIYNENYISSILQYCSDNEVEVVISLFDIDLPVLAKHKQQFDEAGIKLILAPYDSVSICNDKWRTYELLSELGISTPYTSTSLTQTLADIRDGKIAYPLVIKPRWGMASIGVYFADDEDELRVLYKKCYKDILTTHLKFESEGNLEQAILIQQKVKGHEHGIDVLNDLNGQFVACFAKKKVRMRAGETDLGLTVSAEPFAQLSERLAARLQHQGILSVDCFVDGEHLYVTELNCRISGHYPISHLAGFNFPAVLNAWLSNKRPEPAWLTMAEGIYVTKELLPVIQ